MSTPSTDHGASVKQNYKNVINNFTLKRRNCEKCKRENTVSVQENGKEECQYCSMMEPHLRRKERSNDQMRRITMRLRERHNVPSKMTVAELIDYIEDIFPPHLNLKKYNRKKISKKTFPDVNQKYKT